MLDHLGQMKRTHSCGELRREHVGQTVTLMGWVNSYRDHGSLLFIHLRDRDGVAQVVFREEVDARLLEHARQARSEYVLAVTGKLVARTEENMIPVMLDAVRAEATLGEICDVLRAEWGEYREPARF